MTKAVSVYTYHDYRKFLKDVISKGNHGFKSLREVARKSGFSPSYLSMIISGTRNIDLEKANTLLNILKLDKRETKFFGYLVELSDSKKLEEKKNAYSKIKRFLKYRDINHDNYVTFEYLKKWYNVVIRELSGRVDFQEDPKWIKGQLLFPVSISNISKSLSFLRENKLLVTQKSQKLDCVGGVYKLSLATFHEQILNKTTESIYKVDSSDRNILGHTVLLSEQEFDQVKQIMNDALEKIEKLKKNKNKSSRVYHLTMAAVPFS